MTTTYRIARVVGEFQPDRGGVARTVSTLSGLLAKRGFETEIFSLGPSYKGNGLAVHEVPLSPSGIAGLWHSLVRGRFDIIHTHVYSSFVPATALPGQALASARRVITTHFHQVGSRPMAARALFDLSLGRITLKAADQIQVDTSVERDAIARRFAVPVERFEIVPPPLPPFLASLGPPAPRAFGGPVMRLLFVGRLDPQKGLGAVLGALEHLESDASRRYELTVVGRDYKGMMPAYERQVQRLRRARVEFLGAVSDAKLLELYEGANALVLASRYEAFGIVLAEAMSRGLPVIATKVGGIPEVVTDGKNGLLVPYGDAAALSGAILRLAEDPGLAASLSAAGPASVAALLPETVADIEAASYRKLLAAS